MTKHERSTPPRTERQSQAQQSILDQIRVIRARLSPSVLGAVRNVALESHNHSEQPHAGDALLSDFFRNHDPNGTFRAATIRAVQQIDTRSGHHQEKGASNLEDSLSSFVGNSEKLGKLPRVLKLMEDVDQKTQMETNHPAPTQHRQKAARKRSAGDPSEKHSRIQSFSAKPDRQHASVRGGMLSRLMKDWKK